MNVQEAKKYKCCRICRGPDKPSVGNPFMLNYGTEYAHKNCLDIHNATFSDGLCYWEVDPIDKIAAYRGWKPLSAGETM